MGKKILQYWIYLAVCTFTLQVATVLFQPTEAFAAQPNIILINVDNMGWGDLCKNNPNSAICKTNTFICNTSFDGAQCTIDSDCTSIEMKGCESIQSHTPRLDSLANEGVTLTNFYTPVPICTPSRAALMTGLDPRRFNILSTPPGSFVGNGVNELPSRAWTLAEELGKLGYDTAMIGKWQLGFVEGRHSWDQGFEYNYVLPMGIHYNNTGFCLGERYVTLKNPADPNDFNTMTSSSYWQHVNETLPFGPPQFSSQTCTSSSDNPSWSTFTGKHQNKSLTGILTEKAIGYIKKGIVPDINASIPPLKVRDFENADKPFFIYIAYPAPHGTVYVHVKPDQFINSSMGTYSTSEAAHDACIKDKCSSGDYKCVHECELDLLYPYAIKEIDVQVGRLLNCLKAETGSGCATNYSNNTIVIFTSDNGPFMGDGAEFSPARADRTDKMRGGQKNNYEGGVNVPAIAYWPNHWTGAKVLNHPADMMDIYATLVQVAKEVDQGTGAECNAGVTVINRDDNNREVNLDGKNIANVLQYDTAGCGAIQTKDIHTAWLDSYAYASCKTWNWSPTTEWKSGGYCVDSYDENYPVAIRSHVPNTNLNPFNYKLYWDYNYSQIQWNRSLQLGRVYDLLLHPGESISEILPVAGLDINTLTDKAQAYHNSVVEELPNQYYLPSIKDVKFMSGSVEITWENYLTVMARDPNTKMDVKISLFNLNGERIGQYIYSDSHPAANELALPAGARVAQRPSWIAGGGYNQCNPSCPSVEGSLVIETSAPAMVNTNTIVSSGQDFGFDIYEAPKARSVHTFGKNYDGQNMYQVYLLIQNVYAAPRNVSIKLLDKDGSFLAIRTVNIPAFATYKIRPCEVAESIGDLPKPDGVCGTGLNFNGTVVVYSNNPPFPPTEYTKDSQVGIDGFGIGLQIPALNRYEAGTEALTIYESVDAQPTLYFPHIKDGTFGGTLDYQNSLSVINPNSVDVNITIQLWDNDGKNGSEKNDPEVSKLFTIKAGQKQTWRPIEIFEVPRDFEGSIVITSDSSDRPIVGQTNVLYPGINAYRVDAFSLYESARPGSVLNFPKAYDNIVNDGHLFDNYVYIQNPDGTSKNIKIELFNNDGAANGGSVKLPNGSVVNNSGVTVKDGIVTLAPNVTYVFRPKDIVGDGTGKFRGSVKVTETLRNNIAGVLKYEVHYGIAGSAISAITVVRSMGQ